MTLDELKRGDHVSTYWDTGAQGVTLVAWTVRSIGRTYAMLESRSTGYVRRMPPQHIVGFISDDDWLNC